MSDTAPDRESRARRQLMRELRTLARTEYAGRSLMYFIQPESGGLIKIGITIDLPHRLTGIWFMGTLPLRVLGTIPGDRELELAAHAAFDHLWHHGEWFRPAPELVRFIASYAQGSDVRLLPPRPRAPLSMRLAKAERNAQEIARLHEENARLRFRVRELENRIQEFVYSSTCEECDKPIEAGTYWCEEHILCELCGDNERDMAAAWCQLCEMEAMIEDGICLECRAKHERLGETYCEPCETQITAQEEERMRAVLMSQELPFPMAV